MPADTEKQRRAAGAAYAAAKGDAPVSGLKGPSKDMYDSMGKKELGKMSSKKELQEKLRAYITKVVKDCLKEMHESDDADSAPDGPDDDSKAGTMGGPSPDAPYSADSEDIYGQRYLSEDFEGKCQKCGHNWLHHAFATLNPNKNLCTDCAYGGQICREHWKGQNAQVSEESSIAKPVLPLEKTKVPPVKGVKDKDIVAHDDTQGEELKYEGDADEEIQAKKEKKSDKK